MVTLAPELPGALELIEVCVERGVIVSLGHSEASAGVAARAFGAGARAVTHLFNAMEPPRAREPGLAGAALADETVTLQLIADGVHVSDDMLRIALACAPGRVTLVSDAIAAAGVGDGTYRLGELELSVSDGTARRPDGTLAGSAGRLRDGLTRLRWLGVADDAAIASVTSRPAQLLNLVSHGWLERGGRADLLVLDEQLDVQAVIVGGRPGEAQAASVKPER
jgi:N-acetylglucosamine-6-phosphate deacetylase